jgi:hypothetical protein
MPPRRKQRAAVAPVLLLALLAPGCAPHARHAPPGEDSSVGPSSARVGLAVNDPRAYQGYTLLAPMTSTKTYLIDMQGRVVRTWASDCRPALGAYLLENGHLLRTGTLDAWPAGPAGPGAGGRVQELTWEGELVWDFKLASDKQLSHHDVCKLPGGNVLLIVWEIKSAEEAVAAGRRPETVRKRQLLPDCLLEVRPTGKTSGEVVWEWHAWDHLVQDHDKTKANYGDVTAHPELIDVNYGEDATAPLLAGKAGLDKLRSIGYLGSPPGGKAGRIDPDWTHVNAVAYNAELDQVALTVHAFSEIWVIDHGTTTAQAAGHTGGRHGKGGDLLYRWGNPRAYRAGKEADRRLFSPHDGHWVPRGLPGAGHLLVFNNGDHRPGGSYSSVEEVALPVDGKGRYSREPGSVFGPKESAWSYAAPRKSDFYSLLLSGAQRLPNGDTLICSGIAGKVFEVTPGGEVVWEYTSPVRSGPSGPALPPGWAVPGGGGGPPGFGPGGPPGGAAGPPVGGSLFRAPRYSSDYPGLAGRDLTPGPTLEGV